MVKPTYNEWEGVPFRGILKKLGRGLSPIRNTLQSLASVAKGTGFERKLERLQNSNASLRAQNDALRAEIQDLKRDMERLKWELLPPCTSIRRPAAINMNSKAPLSNRKRKKLMEDDRRTRINGRITTVPPNDAAEFPPLPPPKGVWTTVQGRRARKRSVRGGTRAAAAVAAAPPATESTSTAPGRWARKPPPQAQGTGRAGAAGRPSIPPSRIKKKRGGAVRPNRRITAPNTAAVIITALEGRSYAYIMGDARRLVDLNDIGISPSNMAYRRAINGAVKLIVSGENGPALAYQLARNLEAAIGATAKVARPTKMAEIRVVNLDDIATRDDVIHVVCAVGECPPASLIAREIRRSANGLGAIWIRLPLTAVNKDAEGGKLRIGWGWARVRLLQERPLQCYACLEYGHAASSCRAEQDRRGRCFNCGGVGHQARACVARSRCPLCHDAGRDSGHRMGGRTSGAPFAPYKKRRGLPAAPQEPIRDQEQVQGMNPPASSTPADVNRRRASRAPTGDTPRRGGGNADLGTMPPPPSPGNGNIVSQAVLRRRAGVAVPVQETARESENLDSARTGLIGGISQEDLSVLSADVGWGGDW